MLGRGGVGGEEGTGGCGRGGVWWCLGVVFGGGVWGVVFGGWCLGGCVWGVAKGGGENVERVVGRGRRGVVVVVWGGGGRNGCMREEEGRGCGRGVVCVGEEGRGRGCGRGGEGGVWEEGVCVCGGGVVQAVVHGVVWGLRGGLCETPIAILVLWRKLNFHTLFPEFEI